MTIFVDGKLTDVICSKSNNGRCPECGYGDPFVQYGYSPYGLGIVSLCKCGEYFDFIPDMDGFEEE